MNIDDEFLRRIAELKRSIEELAPDRREQLQRELDGVVQRAGDSIGKADEREGE